MGGNESHESNSKPPRGMRVWLELLRLPNLLTVPGDPLAGFLLAGGWDAASIRFDLLPVILASLCLYSGGLLLNDFFDRAEDFRDRPRRPIPSGRVASGHVFLAGLALLAAGIVAAFLTGVPAGGIAVLLVLVIVAYDAGGKRLAGLGPILMGLCRALSLMLGAFAVGIAPPLVVWWAAGGILFYIATVTLIASGETRGLHVPVFALGPAVVLLNVFLLLPQVARLGLRETLLVAGIGGIITAYSFYIGRRMIRAAAGDVSKYVGQYIALLLLLQAGYCSVADLPGQCAAVVLVLLLPVFRVVGRWFYSS